MFADLVLEGGGVKGIALVGAISVLEERGYQFRRVAGTSAGAIVGSLVAANAGAAELEEIMRGVEGIWSLLKRSMANFAAADLDGLVRIIKRRLKKIQYRPHLIDGCLAPTGLELERAGVAMP